MAIQAYGTTLAFTPAGGAKVRVGQLSAIGELAPDSEAVDVTTLDSAGGYRQHMQGLRDAGELEVTGFHDKADAGQAALRAAFASGAVGDVEIAFTDGVKVSFKAFVKSHSVGSAEVDGAVGFGAVLRATGPVTIGEVSNG